MMRTCPVCSCDVRTYIWTMDYLVPDGWPIMDRIDWHTCADCGLLYGDGNFDQVMLNEYYRRFYGYGVNSTENIDRLRGIADWVIANFPAHARFVDFGGAGDDGRSVTVDRLNEAGYTNAHNITPGEPIPDNVDVLLASHVLEHIYDLPDTMIDIRRAMRPNGLFILDGPDATGLLREWRMPMLDFNTKHIQHFRLQDYLNLGKFYGFELWDMSMYKDTRPSYAAPAYRLYFRPGLDVARDSMRHVTANVAERLRKMEKIDYPVNIWGLGDITWHLLAQHKLDVLDYIDNDPAYRGQTYQGKPVLDRPTNDAPIVILAQGQRKRLIENIRAAGITNEIVEV